MRGSGLFFGIELVSDKNAKTPASELTSKIVNQMKDEGILLSKLGINYNTLKIRLSSGQVSNPCEDERFIKISEKYVDQMTEEEYQYYLQKDKECSEYDKNNDNQKPLENNPLKVDNIDSLENLSVSNKPINLWPIIFLILIISLI